MAATLVLAFAAILVVIVSLTIKNVKQVYFWQNDSGEVIQGTSFRLFTAPLISLRDNRLAHLGLYLLRFFPMPKLMITDSQIASKFMAKQHKYSRLKDFRMGYIFENLFGRAVGTASGPEHKYMRSIFDKGYSAEIVTKNLGMMEEECEQFLHQTMQDKKGVITMDDMLHVTFRVLVKYTFGSGVSEEDFRELSEIRELTATLIGDTFTNPLIKLPFYKYLPTDPNRRLAEYKRRWKAIVDRFVKKINEDHSTDENCALYKILQTLAENPENLTREQLEQTLEEASLANVDITSGSTSWLVFHAALYTDLQKELTSEIEKNSGPLDMDTLSLMEFLGKFVKESARRRPVLEISTPEYITCPMMIGNYHTPAKFEVSMDINAVNNDSRVWKDPTSFNPRRFDDETASMRKCLFRFGIGSRRCLGYRLADTFMKVLLITALRSYKVTNETVVKGDDESVPVNRIGIFAFPNIKFRIEKKTE